MEQLDEIVMSEQVKVRTAMYTDMGRTFDGRTVALEHYEPINTGQLDLFEMCDKEYRPVQLYRLKPEYRQ